jgi:hypothetical protein
MAIDPFGVMRPGITAGEDPNPYASYRPAGLQGLESSLTDMATMGERLAGASDFSFPKPVMPASIAFSPSRNELYVQGQTFSADDAQRALEVEPLLDAPGTGLPQGDWVPLDAQAYGQYLQAIRNPSLGRLASKNFGRGVDMTQLLAGRGLQFAGAEEMGGGIVAQQMEDLRKTSPYERMATDIGQPNRGVLDWFVANLAQQGPNIVESVVTAALGAGAGAAAGGGPNPFSAAGGALAALAGRQSVKQAVLAAAKKYQKGEVLDAAETKLLHEMAGTTAAAQIKQGRLYASPQGLMNADQFAAYAGAGDALKLGAQQARIGGAGIATGLQNYATGVADIYGETVESGDPDRATAAMLGIPYAAFETLPEFLLAGKVFGNIGAAKAPLLQVPGIRGKLTEGAKRAGAGLFKGGALEGGTEAAQEGLLLAANEDVDWNSAEGINRLVNSFAAGFGVGGPIGAVANLSGNKPANLLNPAASSEPLTAEQVLPTRERTRRPPRPPAPAFTGAQGELFGAQLPGPMPGVAPAVAPEFGPAPEQLGLPFDQPGAAQLQPGQQGVLPLFPMSQAETAQRMQPEQYATTGLPQLPPEVPPGQMPFQFAPPAPEAPVVTPSTEFGQQVQRAQLSPQRQAEFDAAMQQRQAQLDADYERALVQRDQQLAGESLRRGVRQVRQQVPTEQVPQQLPLFGPRGLPRPSGSERLRRGMEPPVTAKAQALKRPTPGEFQQAGQLPMFTQAGEPSVAALKGAALRRGPVTPVAETGGQQAPPATAAQTRKNADKLLKKARKEAEEADKARKEAEVALKEAEQARKEAEKQAAEALAAKAKAEQEQADAVQKREAASVPPREPAETGAGVGAKVPTRKTLTRKGKAVPKEEGQAGAVPDEVAPVPISITLADGSTLENPDGKKFLATIEDKIKRFEQLLNCVKGA